MLVYDLEKLKPSNMLLYVKDARTSPNRIQGTAIGAAWTRVLFGTDVPEEARLPTEAVPWTTLWEAMLAGYNAGRFTEVQYQSLLDAVRLLESTEDREKLFRDSQPETSDCYTVD